MPVTVLVEVKQQLWVLVPGWVTICHVLFFHEWVMVWAFMGCQLRTKHDTVNNQRICANCVDWCLWSINSDILKVWILRWPDLDFQIFPQQCVTSDIINFGKDSKVCDIIGEITRNQGNLDLSEQQIKVLLQSVYISATNGLFTWTIQILIK